MYQVTAPLTKRQVSLITEYQRLERLSVVYPAQAQRRAAIEAELEQIEQQKHSKALGVAA